MATLAHNNACYKPAVDSSAVLLFDANASRRQATAAVLSSLNCRVLQATSTSQGLGIMSNTRVDLVVADMGIPDLGGSGLCRAMREPSLPAQVPVVLMVQGGSVDDEVQALEAGAYMVLRHSAHPRALRASVENCLRRASGALENGDTETILFALAQSVEERDPALGQHCERLALMAAGIGTALGLDPESIIALQRGGYLHDIGKVGIPDSVLFKPGPLTPEEWTSMKSHTERGERICRNVRSLRAVLPVIRHHHERWDGGGYPDGLRGEQIPLLARIVQVVDIYDALTTARPYKRAFRPAEAVDILREETAKGWRDPHLVDTFCRLLPLFQPSGDADWAHVSLQSLAASLDRFRLPGLLSERAATPQPVKLASGL